MGAPSELHEGRCSTLESIAFLAGCSTPASLGPGCFPDVVLLDSSTRRLFVGDGKASETSGNFETLRRLRRYARSAVPWAIEGYTIRFAICHDAGAAGWDVTLRSVLGCAGLGLLRTGRLLLDDVAIYWADSNLRPTAAWGIPTV
jgi:hypothetical protein